MTATISDISRAIPFGDTEDQILREEIASGTPMKQIALRLGRPVSSVHRRANRLGLRTPRRRKGALSEAERDQILGLYTEGVPYAQIARQMDRPIGTVSRIVAEAGASDRQKLTGPVRRRPDGTRECRGCSLWLPGFAFAGPHEGTCRECRNFRSRMRRTVRAA